MISPLELLDDVLLDVNLFCSRSAPAKTILNPYSGYLLYFISGELNALCF